MKNLLLVAGLLLGQAALHGAISWDSAPASVPGGQSYTVTARADWGGAYADSTLYKNGAFFAYGWGYSSASASGDTTDYGPQTVNFQAEATFEIYNPYTGESDFYYETSFRSVAITQPNNAPTIAWSQNPASVPLNQWFTIEARGNDADGNLSNVNVWREWVPHAFADGGNGFEKYSGNGTSGSVVGTITFMAQAWDSAGAASPMIFHTVNIYVPNLSPTIAWVNNPASAWVNQWFNVQARGNDADSNLAWVRVWKVNPQTGAWEPFAFNGGGNGAQGFSDNNAAVGTLPLPLTFKALAGDSAGAESGYISHTVTINNRAPSTLTLTAAGPTLGYNSTYLHYTMFKNNPITVTTGLQDPDGNLVNHTLRYQQVPGAMPLDAAWFTLGDSTPSNGASSTKQGTLTIQTPGRWDFNAFGHDGYLSHPGNSVTVWVYGDINGSTFVSQSLNGAALGATPAPLTLRSGDLTATVSISMKNTGQTLWEKVDAQLNTPHRLGSVGTDAAQWGTSRRDLPVAQIDPEPFPGTNDTATFSFTFNIPQKPRTYSFQWQMLEDGVPGDPFFGQLTPAVTITVLDTTPPTAPTNLSVANLGTTSFRLNWTASVENGPTLSYDVFRTINGVTTPVGNTSNTFIDVTGLASGLTYTMKVVAKDGVGLTTASQTLNVMTIFDPNADNDSDGVTNGVELSLGLNPNDPTDVRVFNFTYDKINQLKTGPGGTYQKDAEGNIKKAGPQ